jgi:hypothetical protein
MVHRWISFLKIDISLEWFACCVPSWHISHLVCTLFGILFRHRCISCKSVIKESHRKLFPHCDQVTVGRTATQQFMYFPTSVARQFCTVPPLPNASPEPVLSITPSPHKSLFCTLSRDGIAIWRVRVCATFPRLDSLSRHSVF